MLSPKALAQGVLSDKPEVQAALNRFAGGHNYASDAERARDQAVLFANNDAINKARLNNEIPDAAYQAAQKDFAKLNQDFAAESAKAAGADFTVQKSSSPNSFVPGTDSDYITVVQNKGQIAQMQEGYNKRVNDYLKKNGVPEQRANWHNKLDTDFMADPTHVTDPDEFRDIAKINNDAYKRRMAAEYERISRAGDGSKIGPEHVNGYMEEMNDFSRKKSGKIDEMLAKGPSHFSDPANRAEIFQAMAQEQKYNSRLESLDDYLRAQEGLPPRNRGLTAAKLGSNRAPGNAANIRAGHAVSEASRLAAMEDLAETMGQVAKKNPAFNPNAADDIAKIVEQLPAERRAGVLARIRANGSPGLVDDIVTASSRAGRMPPGSSLADDVARAGSKMDDAARIANKLDDLADVGTGRGAFGAAIDALEVIGKAADAAEVAVAATRLAGLFSELDRALDPNTPLDEAQALLEKIKQTADELRDSAALGAIMQRYPPIAAIYGAWTLGCLGGELVSASREVGELFEGSQATGSCLDRQMSAWDRAKEDLTSWWTGEPTQRDANAQALCDKLVAGLKSGRYRMKKDWTSAQACHWIRYGNPIGHMVERTSTTPDDVPEEPKLTAQCDRLTALVASAGRASADESDKYISDLSAAEAAAREEGNCGSEVFASAASARTRLQKVSTMRSRLQAAISSCDVDVLPSLKAEVSSLGAGALEREITLLQKVQAGVSAFNGGKSAFDAGRYAPAKPQLQSALEAFKSLPEGACQSFADRARRGLETITKVEAQQARVDRAIANCDIDALKKIASSYKSQKHPFYQAALDRVNAALPKCEESDRVAAEDRFCKEANGRIDAASADFKANRIDAAAQKLEALSRELTTENTKRCPDVRNRMQRGRENIQTLTAEMNRLTAAIEACDIDRLQKLASHYGTRKHPWYREHLPRVRDVIKKCENDERERVASSFCDEANRRIDAASTDFKASRFDAAAQKLIELAGDLTTENTKRCPEIRNRMQRGRENIRIITNEMNRLADAIQACDVGKLNKLVSYYGGRKHPWYRQASANARRGIGNCERKPPSREEAIADCRRQVANQGKVYATTKFKPDGSYSCHWCEPGQVAQGNVCVPARRAAEAGCRRQAAEKGKVYARTEIRNDGSSVCHWCEPGYSYANGKCWTPAQLAEINCRQDAARKGKVFARARVLANGRYNCEWCEPGHTFVNGQCWTNNAVAEANCRRDIARRGKVYGTTVVYRNGQYRCFWCQPGQYFRNGNCHSRAGDIARAAGAISNLIEAQRRRNARRPTPRPTIQQGRRQTGRGSSRPPARCVVNGFINQTDPRCSKYWN